MKKNKKRKFIIVGCLIIMCVCLTLSISNNDNYKKTYFDNLMVDKTDNEHQEYVLEVLEDYPQQQTDNKNQEYVLEILEDYPTIDDGSSNKPFLKQLSQAYKSGNLSNMNDIEDFVTDNLSMDKFEDKMNSKIDKIRDENVTDGELNNDVRKYSLTYFICVYEDDEEMDKLGDFVKNLFNQD